ncbi:MAG: phosphocholine cytidylyltransferase family protein [SAR202 cluster bacterium]|nr:phosphocholine cytidylyltransferase family protein [SAR202 cluster bacterium]
MKVIILAAGRGTRLGHHTKEIPKGLVDVNGKSIIERQIELFKKNGITEIVIVRGYKKEKFCWNDVTFIDNEDFANNNQLASLVLAQNMVSGSVLILFGDLIFEQTILDQIFASNSDISIAVDLNWKERYDENRNNQFPALAEIENDKITRISENKSLARKKLSGEFFGIMKLSSKGSKILTDVIEKTKHHKGKFHDSDSFTMCKIPDIIQEIIDLEFVVKPILVDGKWFEVDTILDLEKAKTIFQ